MSDPLARQRLDRSKGETLLEAALILGLFAAYAAWPAPDGNETYYLGKAKHFWTPDWGRDVLFLESRNAHTVFYAVSGWMGRWLPLDALAWVLRVCIWTFLAVAWQRLSFALVPRRGFAVLSAALLLWLNERGNLAGEWLVGGAEAKGVAYACVFLALERCVRADGRRGLLFLGLAASFHPLVGGWAFLAGSLAWFSVSHRRRDLISIGLGLLVALPGMWWALRLNAGTPAATIHRAAEIMVFERAPHHLLPAAFPESAFLRHLCLGVLWIALVIPFRHVDRDRPWRRFVAIAMCISALGLVLWLLTRSRPVLAATLLQYYWFRLSDVMVPAGLALATLVGVDGVRGKHPLWGRTLIALLALVGTLHVGQRVGRIREATAPRSDWSLTLPLTWPDVCAWAGEHTPETARFLTPAGGASFLWRSGRRDVVNWKDVPQDARGIVAWWECMRDIHGVGSAAGPFRGRPFLDELPADRLRQLGAAYGAEFAVLVRGRAPRPELPQVYANEGYVVVRLSE